MKRSILLVVLMVVLFAGASRALAADTPILVYVDTAWTGTESGSPDNPYNTIAEATVVAQNNKGGGLIMLGTKPNYQPLRFVNGVTSGNTGIPLAGPVLYGLVAVLSGLLILAGWLLGSRSRRLQHRS